MSGFIFISLLALVFALACVLWPLWRPDLGRQFLLLGLALLFIIPMTLLGIYAHVGSPETLMQKPQPVDELREELTALAKSLERDPNQWQAWMALGTAYKNLESFNSAEHAFRRALNLEPESPLTQIELAETLILERDEAMATEAQNLVDAVLGVDPQDQKALWLSGVLAFSQERYQTAMSQWQMLLDSLPPEASIREAIETQIDRASMELNGGSMGREVWVRLQIDSGLRVSLSGDETVFIIAQAANGPTTPLAAKRLRVEDLPQSIRLSDADQMIEGMNLSSAGEITLTARVSRSGEVTAQPGDLQGKINVQAETEVLLVIDQVLD